MNTKVCSEEELRDLCRSYHAHLNRLHRIGETGNLKTEREREVRWMKEHIRRVDSIFDEIEKNYGMYARQMLWEYYVDGCKQPDIAYKYGISLRTMQRRFSSWIRCVTDEA